MSETGSALLTIKLGHKILPGRVTVGNYDGKQSFLTAATHGERILLVPLKKTSSLPTGKTIEASSEDLTYLNIDQPITCLSAGQMLKNSDRSFLFVGTLSNVFGYDVENNKDLFFKEIPDGVNAIVTGTLGGLQESDTNSGAGAGGPVAIVGGNCTLQGFDAEGNDCFWTVTGDNVGAIAFLDFDGDGDNEMVVGSDDFDIRIFKGDQIVAETSETDAISAIAPMHANIFAYALVNGTIGVYEKLQRLWRIKSKNHAIAICGFDFDGDGIPELVTGWSNGKLDIRNIRNGEVLFKDNFPNPLAGLCTVDLEMDGRNYLVCCDVEGEVRLYQPSSHDGRILYISPNVEQEAVRELSVKKHHLLLELKNYDASNASLASTGGGASGSSGGGAVNTARKLLLKGQSLTGTGSKSSAANADAEALLLANKPAGAIPAKTQLHTAFSINTGNLSADKPAHIEIALSTNNDTVIRSALIFAEGIFPGECHVVHPAATKLDSKICVPLIPPKNVVVDLHIKVYVGYPDTRHFHVFEMTRQLPRFAMFSMVSKDDDNKPEVDSYVKLPIQERPTRISMWLNQNFLLSEEVEFKTAFSVQFVSLRNNHDLILNVGQNGSLEVRTIDMDLAGDVVQSICQFLNIADLETEADFPEEIQQLEVMLRGIEEYQESNERLGADISDQSGVIKSLLIRAEDARLIGDTKSMRKWYMQLNEVNRALITQHQIRCTTNENVAESIKSINQIIQKAARLRVGRPKANVITASREAIRTKNIEALTRIIVSGAN